MLPIYYNEKWNNSKKPTKTRLLIYFFTENVNFTFKINLATEITYCLQVITWKASLKVKLKVNILSLIHI